MVQCFDGPFFIDRNFDRHWWYLRTNFLLYENNRFVFLSRWIVDTYKLSSVSLILYIYIQIHYLGRALCTTICSALCTHCACVIAHFGHAHPGCTTVCSALCTCYHAPWARTICAQGNKTIFIYRESWYLARPFPVRPCATHSIDHHRHSISSLSTVIDTIATAWTLANTCAVRSQSNSSWITVKIWPVHDRNIVTIGDRNIATIGASHWPGFWLRSCRIVAASRITAAGGHDWPWFRPIDGDDKRRVCREEHYAFPVIRSMKLLLASYVS